MITKTAWRVVFCVVVAGCAPPAPATPETAPERRTASAMPPGSGPGESSFESNPLWKAARSLDPLDLARLADQEGAEGLLVGVHRGDPRTVRPVALAALPHADDAELALPSLCVDISGDASEPLLRAVHDIVARPPESREAFDPTGRQTCKPILKTVAKEAQEPGLRDLAESSLRMMSEHEPRVE